jgi:hypothetical protein
MQTSYAVSLKSCYCFLASGFPALAASSKSARKTFGIATHRRPSDFRAESIMPTDRGCRGDWAGNGDRRGFGHVLQKPDDPSPAEKKLLNHTEEWLQKEGAR